MASALTRFGLQCRHLRTAKKKSMGDQAEAMGRAVHEISAIEVGRAEPSEEYIVQFQKWLALDSRTCAELLKRSRNNVVEFRQKGTGGDTSSSMRLFRKISKMDSNQIRRFQKKLHEEVQDDR